jgi:hypothetical protein
VILLVLWLLGLVSSYTLGASSIVSDHGVNSLKINRLIS